MVSLHGKGTKSSFGTRCGAETQLLARHGSSSINNMTLPHSVSKAYATITKIVSLIGLLLDFLLFS